MCATGVNESTAGAIKMVEEGSEQNEPQVSLCARAHVLVIVWL